VDGEGDVVKVIERGRPQDIKFRGRCKGCDSLVEFSLDESSRKNGKVYIHCPVCVISNIYGEPVNKMSKEQLLNDECGT
jgi:hypothetical protein